MISIGYINTGPLTSKNNVVELGEPIIICQNRKADLIRKEESFSNSTRFREIEESILF